LIVFLPRFNLGNNVARARSPERSKVFRETCAYYKKVLSLSKDLGESVHNVLKAMADQADKSPIMKTLKEIEKIKAAPAVKT
jgi:hypothetical protein